MSFDLSDHKNSIDPGEDGISDEELSDLANGDSDLDGIKNLQDECPQTPAGIEVDEISLQYIYELYENKLPVVFDADALNVIAKYKINWKNFNFPFVLTPHPKEFDRLFSEHNSEYERRITAIQKAKELNYIIVLKGHKTFITDGIQTFENTTGNSGLAKGGSGDALTGMITSFLAQGYTTLEAAKLGVYLHGLAADITLQSQSEESMLITDVIENIRLAFKHLNSEIQ
mgnify:CR=1 FL=1